MHLISNVFEQFWLVRYASAIIQLLVFNIDIASFVFLFVDMEMLPEIFWDNIKYHTILRWLCYVLGMTINFCLL